MASIGEEIAAIAVVQEKIITHAVFVVHNTFRDHVIAAPEFRTMVLTVSDQMTRIYAAALQAGEVRL